MLPRWLGLAAAVAAALQVVAWIFFFAPSGILAVGALLAWLGACSIVMLVEPTPAVKPMRSWRRTQVEPAIDGPPAPGIQP